MISGLAIDIALEINLSFNLEDIIMGELRDCIIRASQNAKNKERKQAVTFGVRESLSTRITLKENKRRKAIVYEDDRIRVIVERKV